MNLYMDVRIKESTLKQIGIGVVVATVLLVGGIAFFGNSEESSQTESVDSGPNFVESSASDFKDAIETETDVVILDVRTPGEYQSGHIAGAINVDYEGSSFVAGLEELDKSANYKVYCRSGNRSTGALAIMKELGFSNVEELDQGINSWLAAGYETTSCSGSAC